MNVAPLVRQSLRNAAIILLVLILLPYLIAPFYRFVMPVSTPMLMSSTALMVTLPGARKVLRRCSMANMD